MRPVRFRIVLLLLTAALAFGQTLSIAYARESVTVKIYPQATLVAEGQAVEVTVKVACDLSSGEVLEAFVYVVQDGNQSNFAAIPVVCDGRQHESLIRVAMFPDGLAFHRGTAIASAFVLLLDPVTGGTVSGDDTRTVKIR
jgi:hypothetical protein